MFTGFHWVLLSFFLVWSSLIENLLGFHRVWFGFTGFYWVLAGFDWVWLGFSGFDWVLFRVLSSFGVGISVDRGFLLDVKVFRLIRRVFLVELKGTVSARIGRRPRRRRRRRRDRRHFRPMARQRRRPPRMNESTAISKMALIADAILETLSSLIKKIFAPPPTTNKNMWEPSKSLQHFAFHPWNSVKPSKTR